MEQSGSGWLDWLRQETEVWVREGLVQRNQAALILARYGMAESETPRTLKGLHTIHALAAMGAVLVGVGVLMVVGSNWEAIPRYGRLLLLVQSIAACYLAGFQMAHVRNWYPAVGKALLLLGSLLWCSSIFLIGQMYHLSDGAASDYTAGVFYCFAGVLPAAYILRSAPHLAVALGAAVTWLVLVASGDAFFGETMEGTLFTVLLAGCVMYAAGMLQREAGESVAHLAAVYRGFGLAAILVILYWMTFGWWGYGDTYTEPRTAGWLLAVALAVPAIAVSAVLAVRKTQTDRVGVAEAAACVLLAAVALLALAHAPVWVAWYASHRYMDHPFITAPQVVFNLLLLALEAGIVALGWFRVQTGLVNLGLTVFFVHLLTRYFDLLGSQLSGGFAFIGAGVVLIALGVLLERQRRHIVAAMKARAA